MNKSKQSHFYAKRISSSPYFCSDFLKVEKDSIEQITQVKMLPFSSEALADIIITNTHTNLSQLSTAEIAHCKLMIHPNSGYDNFSAEFISNANFPIILGNTIRSHAVANFILSALFNHYSSIPKESNWNDSRNWPRKLLSELNILIIGAGHIGTLLEKSLTPLVAELHVHDPYKSNTQLKLENIDVVIPVCSLNKKNYHFINRDFLENLNHDFLLINAARGQLIHTEELISVLKEKPKAFAILDVFEKEPCDFDNFKGVQNIFLSSHIAGVYKNIDLATIEFESNIISDFINLDIENFKKKYHDIILKNRIINNYLI